MKKLLLTTVLSTATLLPYLSFAADCGGLNIWDSASVYTGGDQVQHNNNSYQANWWTQGQNPESHSGQWQEWKLLGQCGGGDGENIAPTARVNGPYSALVGGDITFSSAGSSDSDGTVSAYRWSFGDGATSGEANPAHRYSNPGTYTITLTVTDNAGASSTASGVATITAEGDTGSGECAGLPTYIAGTTYAAGDHVVNRVEATDRTIEYVCDIPGWCSSTAAWAYEPGNGAYWEQAWSEVGECGDGGGNQNQKPIANANGPYSGTAGAAIAFSSSGSMDPDGTIDSFSWNFGDGGTSNAANPSHSYAAAGTYTVTLTVTDDEGASAIHSTVATITGEGDGGLGRRVINGYWHNFDNGSGFIPLKDVSPAFDIVNVSFAEPTSSTSGDMRLVLDANTNETQFKEGVGLLQSRGKKVLISIGGANGQVQLASTAARDKFVTTMIGIIERYNFDGMDIDFEGHSLSLEAGDVDFRNPTTPVIVNTIAAIREICNHFGEDFMLTMAPETFFVQLGYTFYGGISSGADRRAGAYLPVIHALRDKLTFLQVQNYNSGPITGLDDQYHTMGNADFHVAMIDMLLKGFPVAGDAEKFFPPLRQDQVLLGLPAYVQAGGGYTSVEEVQRALDCLIEGSNCPAYNPGRVYPNLRGLMTWSINWDQFSGYSFSQPHRAYLDQLP